MKITFYLFILLVSFSCSNIENDIQIQDNSFFEEVDKETKSSQISFGSFYVSLNNGSGNVTWNITGPNPCHVGYRMKLFAASSGSPLWSYTTPYNGGLSGSAIISISNGYSGKLRLEVQNLCNYSTITIELAPDPNYSGRYSGSNGNEKCNHEKEFGRYTAYMPSLEFNRSLKRIEGSYYVTDNYLLMLKINVHKTNFTTGGIFDHRTISKTTYIDLISLGYYDNTPILVPLSNFDDSDHLSGTIRIYTKNCRHVGDSQFTRCSDCTYYLESTFSFNGQEGPGTVRINIQPTFIKR
ncbi:hypothetical protein [Prevotella sp. 10(H)]|uniref:hypothetical protein n=1 Tax=Prevotella sp. 10(H) TaxID=1158294 RepID=UPI0004A6D922|nr:hypothetical protein [Prevotella sp. 10(H)]